MPPRKKKNIVPVIPAPPVIPAKAGIQKLAWKNPALIAFTLVLLAGASVGVFAQTAGASEQSGCTGVVSCVQSFTSGLWATITRTPPQKQTATAWEQITNPEARATYPTGNPGNPLVLQPKENEFVGIGTDNPRAKLQINGGSSDDFATGMGPGIYIDELEKEINTNGVLSFTYTPRIVLSGSQTSDKAPISPYIDFSNKNGTQYTARIQNKGNDLMLDSKYSNILLQTIGGGNVGIGTTKPSVGLMVNRGETMDEIDSDKKGMFQVGNDADPNNTNIAIDNQSVQARKRKGDNSANEASNLFLNPFGGKVIIGKDLAGVDDVVLNVRGAIDMSHGTTRTAGDPFEGMIMYKRFDTSALNLVGASDGIDAYKRKITFHAQGGSTFLGAINIGESGQGAQNVNARIRPTVPPAANDDIAAKLKDAFDKTEGITISRAASTTYVDNVKAGKETFGNVGIGHPNPIYKLDVNGGDINVAYFGSNLANADKKQKLALANDRIGLDVAEIYQANEDVEVGDVLVAGVKDRTLQKSSKQYEPAIIGVVSGAPALLFEGSELKLGSNPNRFTKGSKPPVALAGRVPVKISLENGPIRVGDYLTSSPKPGVAMRATDPGMALGIALENYNGGGDGKILVFINVGEKNVAAKITDLEKEITKLKKALRR